MITLENLKNYGANTEEGLQRCVNSETLYLRLIDRFVQENAFANLKDALAKHDLEGAFHVAHSLKGVLGNLSLTPLYDIIFEMTELLRNRTDIDYQNYIDKYEESFNKLVSLK